MRSDRKGLQNKIKGIVDFLVTPFDVKDWRRLDEEGLRSNTKFLNDAGVNVLVPCGGMGEISQLTLEEHRRTIEIVVDENKGKALVFPAVGLGTKRAIELASFAERVGAEGILVFIPPWIPYSDEGAYRYIESVARSVQVGVMIMKSPDSNLSIEVINKLVRTCSNVVAVKFEPGGDEIGILNDMIRKADGDVAWVVNTHHDGQLAPHFHMAGADAFMDAIPNFAPRFDLEMYSALVSRDYKKASDIQWRLARVARLMKLMGGVTLVKEAMNLVGLHGGSFRPPMLPATNSQKEQIEQALHELKLM
jgi:4-hydroxy-tetrahydrodipicolinate synthase